MQTFGLIFELDLPHHLKILDVVFREPAVGLYKAGALCVTAIGPDIDRAAELGIRNPRPAEPDNQSEKVSHDDPPQLLHVISPRADRTSKACCQRSQGTRVHWRWRVR